MKTALVVLGMHRSGTSSVAGTLALLGATVPRTLMPPAADNPRGFWESNVVMTLNDQLLAEQGLSWNDWRPGPGRRAGVADDRIRDALDSEFGGADLIVLKDPRMCRLFPEWRTALTGAGYDIRVISPIRAPGEVTASLQARNPLSREHGLRLWLRHVLEAEAATRGLARHLMTWSGFMADWRRQIAIMNTRLGLGLDPSLEGRDRAVDEFLTPDLHRQRTDATVPVMVRHVFETLGRIAAFGEHPDLHARLDDLRLEFDRSCDLFADTP